MKKSTNVLHSLMAKEVNRREFMAILGFGIAACFGFSAVLRLLGHKSPLESVAASGYGSSAYGK